MLYEVITVAYAIRPQDVLRWEGIATIHEETEGVEWYAGQTWYHLFSNRRNNFV